MIRAALLAATLLTFAAHAAPPPLPHLNDLAAKFGARPFLHAANLSPSGNALLFIAPLAGTRSVAVVYDIASGKFARLINDDHGEPSLRSCFWKTDVRIICTISGSGQFYGTLIGYSRVVALDRDGKHLKVLGRIPTTADRGPVQFSGSIIDALPDDPKHVLMEIPEGTSYGGGLAVETVDVQTGSRRSVEPTREETMQYLTDGHGHPRVRMVVARGVRQQLSSHASFLLRVGEHGAWVPIGTSELLGETGFQPLGFDESGANLFVLKPKDGRNALYKIAADGSGREELVYANDTVDVAGLRHIGKYNRPVAAVYVDDTPQYKFFDPVIEKLSHAMVRALPPRSRVEIEDESWDGKIKLVLAGSDTDPARAYLFHTDKHELETLIDLRPALTDLPMAQQKPVRYKAADGTEIPAYLTLPPGTTSLAGLPAIVMPHGGPEARDAQGFDWISQYFAAMGYAVLQPNFRGSTGYGDKFFVNNAFHSWKLAVGDVNDGGRWLLAQGILPTKLAIFGWSYGGYAALQANVLDPDLFRAVVAVAPVTDLGLLKAESNDFLGADLERKRVGSGPTIAEGSPARHADRFKAPVLIFQGDRDLNVNAEQSRRMDHALEHAGKVHQLIMYPGLDHQLADSDARADLLRRSAAFLAEHLGGTGTAKTAKVAEASLKP